jgi:hypothetical protein
MKILIHPKFGHLKDIHLEKFFVLKTLFRPGFENPYSGQVGVENTPAIIIFFSAP